MIFITSVPFLMIIFAKAFGKKAQGGYIMDADNNTNNQRSIVGRTQPTPKPSPKQKTLKTPLPTISQLSSVRQIITKGSPSYKPTETPAKAPPAKKKLFVKLPPTEKPALHSEINSCTTCNISIVILDEEDPAIIDAVNLWLDEQEISQNTGQHSMSINGTDCSIALYFENSHNASQSLLDLTKFIEDNYVLALVGGKKYNFAVSVGEVASLNEIPFISTSVNPENVTQGRPFVFHMARVDPDEATVMAMIGRQVLNGTKTAVLYQNDLFSSKILASDIEKAWEIQNGTVVSSVSFNESNIKFNNYVAQISHLSQSGADVIFAPIASDQTADFMKALRQKTNVPVIGGSGWGDISTILKCSKDCVGVFYTGMTSESTSNRLYSFVKNYNDTYGKRPSSEAILAYDSMKLIKDALIRYEKPSCTSTIVQDRIGL